MSDPRVPPPPEETQPAAPPPETPPGAGPPPPGAPTLVLLLTRPADLVARGRGLAALALAAVAGAALYGAVAGFFTGGWQIALAAAKGPLVLASAVLLCLPSFLVFHLMSGAEASPRRLLQALGGLTALLGLLFAALAPVAWLFSVTSRSLPFLAFLHAALWSLLVMLGLRFLGRVLTPRRRGASAAWALLLWVVALQLASYLGPMLRRDPGEEAFTLRRGLFLTRWALLVDQPEPPPAPGP